MLTLRISNTLCDVGTEPTHERALANMAFFEGLRSNKADQFIDAEIVGTSEGSGRLDDTEREEYEAICREGLPLVRCCVWWVAH